VVLAQDAIWLRRMDIRRLGHPEKPEGGDEL